MVVLLDSKVFNSDNSCMNYCISNAQVTLEEKTILHGGSLKIPLTVSLKGLELEFLRKYFFSLNITIFCISLVEKTVKIFSYFREISC